MCENLDVVISELAALSPLKNEGHDPSHVQRISCIYKYWAFILYKGGGGVPEPQK